MVLDQLPIAPIEKNGPFFENNDLVGVREVVVVVGHEDPRLLTHIPINALMKQTLPYICIHCTQWIVHQYKIIVRVYGSGQCYTRLLPSAQGNAVFPYHGLIVVLEHIKVLVKLTDL